VAPHSWISAMVCSTDLISSAEFSSPLCTEPAWARALFPAVIIALNTRLRTQEVLGLRWRDVDLQARRLVVVQSKTPAGTGRVVPPNDPVVNVLTMIADRFPDRRNEHFVFAAERYAIAGDQAADHTYAVDPSRPIRSLQDAWESAAAGTGRGPIPRFAAHACHSDAGRRGSALGRREHLRMESLDDGAHGEAVRSQWQPVQREAEDLLARTGFVVPAHTRGAQN
jgi:integrase